MSSQNILTAFNEHFIEFVNDICIVFPENRDLLTAKNSLLAIRKANPKMIIKIWSTFVVGKYQKEIENGDISFFIDKDYSNDLAGTSNFESIQESINGLRTPIKNMTTEDQTKAMKYIQNLTKLSFLYDS